MLTKSDIYKKLDELIEECAAKNRVIHLDDITAELTKFLVEHGHLRNARRAAAQYVAAYDRAHLP